MTIILDSNDVEKLEFEDGEFKIEIDAEELLAKLKNANKKRFYETLIKIHDDSFYEMMDGMSNAGISILQDVSDFNEDFSQS